MTCRVTLATGLAMLFGASCVEPVPVQTYCDSIALGQAPPTHPPPTPSGGGVGCEDGQFFDVAGPAGSAFACIGATPPSPDAGPGTLPDGGFSTIPCNSDADCSAPYPVCVPCLSGTCGYCQECSATENACPSGLSCSENTCVDCSTYQNVSVVSLYGDEGNFNECCLLVQDGTVLARYLTED